MDSMASWINCESRSSGIDSALNPKAHIRLLMDSHSNFE
jgi:hypothetical protein